MEDKEKTLYEELFNNTDFNNKDVEVNDNKEIINAIKTDDELLDNIISFDTEEEDKKSDVTLEDTNLFKVIDDTLYNLKLNLEDTNMIEKFDTNDNINTSIEEATMEPTEEKKDNKDTSIYKEMSNYEVKEDIPKLEEIKKEKPSFLYYFSYVCVFILVLAAFSFSIFFMVK